MIEELVVLFVIFVLAMFVGFEVITKVPPTLHTPLMSGLKRHLRDRDHRRDTRVGARHRRSIDGTRVRRDCVRHDQRGRRLHGNRAHAEHVQTQA